MKSHFLVEKDSRGRVSLGQFLTDDPYVVTQEAHGRVVLEPAVVMTTTEKRLLSDPEFRARVTNALQGDFKPLDLDEL
jgi:hypothetical protein